MTQLTLHLDDERTAIYTAYAAAHHRTPDEMLAHDRQQWPGGPMAGFTTWVAQQWEAFGVPFGSRSVTDDELVAFQQWLTDGTTP